jgi:hypothetical protein
MPRSNVKYNPVFAYVPIALPNLDDLVKGTKFSADRLRCLYHQLYMQRLNDSTSDKVTNTIKYKTGWVSLSGKLLTRLATNNYKEHLEFLEGKGLLLIRRDPYTGKKKYGTNISSIQYKIPYEFLYKEGTIRHFKKEIITEHVVLRAIKTVKESFRTEPVKPRHIVPEPIHLQLIAMVNQVRFDIPAAENFLEKISNGQLSVRKTKSGRDRDYDELLLRLDAINDSEFQKCTIDKYGDRLHTTISNLWKELRPYMYFKNMPEKQLAALDIKNSQPYFSSIAINTKLIAQFLPEFSLCVPLVEKYTQKRDYKIFSELCAMGKIYEHWQAVRKLKERDDAKAEIFRIMYGTVYRGKDQKHIKLIFREHFPSVYQSFSIIKSLTELQLPFIKDVFVTPAGMFEGRKVLYKNFSCMMQRMESRIVIRRIAPKLIAEGLCPFVTVHDSFIVPAENEPKVRAIIITEFNSLGVIPPTIKTEILTRRAAHRQTNTEIFQY